MVVSLGGSSVSMVLVDMVVIPEMFEGYMALFTIVDGHILLGITLKSHSSHVHSHLLPYQVNYLRTKIILILQIVFLCLFFHLPIRWSLIGWTR